MVIAVDFHQPDLAELAFLDHAVAGFDQVRRAAPLRADLHHAIVLAGRGHHRLALGNVHADRLLAVDVRPGLDGGDHRQRVPVVRRADQYDVVVLLLEHFAVIGEQPRLFVRGLPLRNQVGSLGQHLRIHVAQRHDLHRRDLDQPQQIALAVPAAADQPDARRFLRIIRTQSRGGDPRGSGREKRTAIHDVLLKKGTQRCVLFFSPAWQESYALDKEIPT